MLLGVVSGLIIGALGLERYLEDWVRDMPSVSAEVALESLTWAERVAAGLEAVRTVVGKVWPYVVVGIGVGAGIHGYVPQDWLASFMGRDAAWWSVPAAVLLGVPMYANTAGILPVIEALTAKGAAMGTALAFMMSVVALSLPEMIILRKVLKPRLIATFVAIVAAGILAVGYLLNAIL
ncbi:permease [uncultured Tepidimonas sp.]|nr:permease [uncultured Tepidimonas sp.]